MSTLLRVSPSVHPTLRLVDPPSDPCPSKRRRGERCFKLHPADMGRWCDDCLDGLVPDLDTDRPDWMGGFDADAAIPADDGRPTMADWIDDQAEKIRGLDSDLAGWLADKIEALASECRFLDATTPDEFEDRSHVLSLASEIADHDLIAERDYFPLEVC